MIAWCTYFKFRLEVTAVDYIGNWYSQDDNRHVECSVVSDVQIECVASQYTEQFIIDGNIITSTTDTALVGTYDETTGFVTFTTGYTWEKMGRCNTINHNKFIEY